MKRKKVIELQVRCEYLKHTPFDQYLSPVTLEEFASCFNEVVRRPPGKEIALDPRRVYIVCQGEVDLSTSYPEIEGKVEAKGFLCRKRQGDIINITQTERDVQRRMTIKMSKVIDTAEDIIITGSGDNDIVLISSSMKALNEFKAVHPELVAPIEAICSSSIEDRLLSISFLEGVPRSKLNVLAAMCRYEAFDANQVVFSENSIGTKLYLVLSGTAQVVARNNDMVSSRGIQVSSRPSSSCKRAFEKSIVLQRSFECGGNQNPLLASAGEIKIAELSTGSFFGETALVYDINRTCSVKTSEKSLFLTICKTDFRNFLQICNTIETALTKSIKNRMVSKLSSLGIPFLTGIPEEVISSLSTSISIEEFPMNHVIFRKHDVGDAFYIIVYGSVRVASDNDEEEGNLGTLGPGQYFGEMAILFSDEHARNATVVVSSEKAILLSIDKDSFKRIFVGSSNPILAEFELRVLQSSAKLKHILAHPFGVASFRIFLEKEHAGENIDFWSAAEDFASCAESIRKDKAQEIWITFCAEYADRQVNLPHSISAALEKDIDGRNDKYPSTLFDAAKNEILKLMERDNFLRYKDSAEFADLQHRLGILQVTVRA